MCRSTSTDSKDAGKIIHEGSPIFNNILECFADCILDMRQRSRELPGFRAMNLKDLISYTNSKYYNSLKTEKNKVFMALMFALVQRLLQNIIFYWNRSSSSSSSSSSGSGGGGGGLLYPTSFNIESMSYQMSISIFSIFLTASNKNNLNPQCFPFAVKYRSSRDMMSKLTHLCPGMPSSQLTQLFLSDFSKVSSIGPGGQ